MLLDEHVEGLLERYIKHNTVISFGTGQINLSFLKKLALHVEHNDYGIKVVPTSYKLFSLCNELKIKTAALDDTEIDVAFDFVDQVDEDFNYASSETTSLVRDKMIAQTSGELVVVCEEKDFVKKINCPITVETSTFAIKKTMIQLMNLGEPKQRFENEKPKLSETGNYFVDINVDEIYSTNDLEFQMKRIPGVLETSLFIGYADRVVLHGDTVKVKSRLDFSL